MTGMKRYNLALSDELYAELELAARRRNASMVDVLRRYIRLGLLVDQIDANPNAELLIREGDRERQIVLI
jgi:hypothetical protein